MTKFYHKDHKVLHTKFQTFCHIGVHAGEGGEGFEETTASALMILVSTSFI